MEQRRYGQDITLETRAEAHEKVDKKKRYAEIKSILNAAWPCGLTAKQIAVAMYKRNWTQNDDRNNSAPRLTELCNAGEVEPIGKTVCDYTGKTVTVYALRRD